MGEGLAVGDGAAAVGVVGAAPEGLAGVRAAAGGAQDHFGAAFGTDGGCGRWLGAVFYVGFLAEEAGEVGHGVAGADADAGERKAGGLEGADDEAVPFFAVRPVVGAVVEFDAEEGAHGLGIAEEKVDVFLVDFVGGGPPVAVVRSLGVEDVAEADFWADGGPAVGGGGQGLVEGMFGRGEEVVAQVVGVGVAFWATVFVRAGFGVFSLPLFDPGEDLFYALFGEAEGFEDRLEEGEFVCHERMVAPSCFGFVGIIVGNRIAATRDSIQKKHRIHIAY